MARAAAALTLAQPGCLQGACFFYIVAPRFRKKKMHVRDSAGPTLSGAMSAQRRALELKSRRDLYLNALARAMMLHGGAMLICAAVRLPNAPISAAPSAASGSALSRSPAALLEGAIAIHERECAAGRIRPNKILGYPATSGVGERAATGDARP